MANSPKSIGIFPERTNELKTLKIGPWIKDRILLIDLGFYKHIMFSKTKQYGGSFNLNEILPFRLVAVYNAEEGKYHIYLTDISPDVLSPEDVAKLYGARCDVELVFKELDFYSYTFNKQTTVMNVYQSQALDPHVNRERFREEWWA